MKITHVTTRVLRTPADNPLVVGLPVPTDTREFVTLELGTDQGLVGVGLTFFGGALTAALKVAVEDRKSTRLNSSHTVISYAVFCLKKKKKKNIEHYYNNHVAKASRKTD